jgi:hypothetical protein
VGRFGAVGLEVSDVSGIGSRTTAGVTVSNDEFVNLLPRPIHVTSTVLIDGGSMQSFGTLPGSSIEYSYVLGDGVGLLAKHRYDSTGMLSTDSAGNLSFQTTGSIDLGATFAPSPNNPNSGTVTIPASLQTFDFGIIPPGGVLELDYEFSFDIITVGSDGFLTGRFSDPFHLSAHPALGIISVEPVTSDVPEPSALLLFGIGLAAISGYAWRRRRRAA